MFINFWLQVSLTYSFTAAPQDYRCEYPPIYREAAGAGRAVYRAEAPMWPAYWAMQQPFWRRRAMMLDLSAMARLLGGSVSGRDVVTSGPRHVADLEQWLQSRIARDTSDADARFLKALTVAHPR